MAGTICAADGGEGDVEPARIPLRGLVATVVLMLLVAGARDFERPQRVADRGPDRPRHLRPNATGNAPGPRLARGDGAGGTLDRSPSGGAPRREFRSERRPEPAVLARDGDGGRSRRLLRWQADRRSATRTLAQSRQDLGRLRLPVGVRRRRGSGGRPAPPRSTGSGSGRPSRRLALGGSGSRRSLRVVFGNGLPGARTAGGSSPGTAASSTASTASPLGALALAAAAIVLPL